MNQTDDESSCFVGLSPALQRTYAVDSLQAGTLQRSAAVRSFASGKATNAARHAAAAGGSVALCTPLAGDTGRAFANVLEQDIELRSVDGATPTRVCTTVLEKGGRATELIEATGPIGEDAAEAILRSIESSQGLLALCGSLPPDVPPEWMARAVRAAAGPVLVDTTGPALRAAVSAGVTLAKPNEEELARTVGRPLPDLPSTVAAARELQSAGVRRVLVTRGERPAIDVGETVLLISPPTPQQVISVIGAGDAMCGTLVDQLRRGATREQQLRRAFGYVAAYLETAPPDRVSPERAAQLAATVRIEPFVG